MAQTWDAGAPGVLTLPSGRLVRGRALRRPVPDGPAPSFALHLLGNPPPPVPWASRWVRWPDWWLPRDPADARAALEQAWRRSAEERVEVACGGGRGRTGTALACLAVLDGVPPAEAVGFVRERYHRRAVETPWQRRFVPRTAPVNRWLAETGGTRGAEFAARFAALAAEGADVHGEAALVDALLPRGAAVLDGGCGTGRVAVELARRGHGVAGVDLDPSMVAQARALAPHLPYARGDLLTVAERDLGGVGPPFDAVVLAGNVVVYLTEGTETAVVARLAGWLRPGGVLVAGFATDRHIGTADHDRWCRAAGLEPVRARATWAVEAPPPGPGDDYAVLVHRRPPAASP